MSHQRIILLVALLSIIVVAGSAAGQETAPSTGHEYEFIEAEGDGITWQEAREAASDRTRNGKQGYLVTITSEEEQEFVQSLTTQSAWIGASDSAEEGTWRWITGPEGEENNGQGRHFFTQSGDGGSTINGKYANWRSGEPNNAANPNNPPENHAHIVSGENATWNDNQESTQIEGYIVEYGGLENSDDSTQSGGSNINYEFVEAEGDGITWQEAREAASDRTRNGKQGYLATITSKEEQESIQSLTTQSAWIGASDSAEEGTWRWITGPEGEENNGQGRHFFAQSGDGGSTVNGEYANWRSGEPNNAANPNNPPENYAHIVSGENATWNDNQESTQIEGYIVEYGGLEESDDNTRSEESDDNTRSEESDDNTRSEESDDNTRSEESDDNANTDSGQVKTSISFEPSPPEAGEQVAFSGADSTAPNEEIISYNWKFGDGETATGDTVSHTYSESGGYNVELTVITDQGNSYSTNKPISIAESETATSDGGSISVETPGFGFGSFIISLGGLAYIIRRK